MLILFANPTSGRGKGAKVLAIIEEYLVTQELHYISISTTSLSQSLTFLKEKTQKYPEAKVIVIGGDGMVHAAINNIENNPIGLIPA
jgi:diacylglycerol kinase family enzyme